MKKAANKMLDIIRDIVLQELDREDNIILCQVKEQKDSCHYDLTDAADESHILHNILNVTTSDFNVGDYIYLYKINNDFAQSFIVSQILPYVDDKKVVEYAHTIVERVLGYIMGYINVEDPTDRGVPLGGTSSDSTPWSGLLGYEEN